jgi:hypothetical protein
VLTCRERIASTVITWDIAELQKQSAKVEKNKDGLAKEYVEAIKGHMQMSREEREEQRMASRLLPSIYDRFSLTHWFREGIKVDCRHYFRAGQPAVGLV